MQNGARHTGAAPHERPTGVVDRVDIEGKTIVITGAARGIGAAIAKLAASRGANVVVADISQPDGEAVAQLIQKNGGRATFKHCDVTIEDQCLGLMDHAFDQFGSLDVLVNNAGIHEAMVSSQFSFEEMTTETFDRVMDVNLRGPYICSRAALKYLRKSTRNPSVINAGSTASFVGYPFGLAYGVSKGGIALLTKNLAVALAPYGIRSNSYCPASTQTEMVASVSAKIGSLQLAPEATSQLAQLGAHLVRRIGDANDVAELVCFLASDRASFINGALMLIDGGTLAWRDTVDAMGME